MWNLVWSPVRFFDTRRRQHIDWIVALTGPALCAGLQRISASILSSKTRPILDIALARLDVPFTTQPSGSLFVVMGALTYPMYFGLLTLAFLALDVLAKNSGQPARLTQCTALSFYTQVPYCLLMILVAWVWVPEPIRLPAGPSTAEVLTAVRDYRQAMLSAPLLSTSRLLSYYSLIWLAAVLSVALKVVTGLSLRATAVVTMVLLGVCTAGPSLGATLRLLP